MGRPRSAAERPPSGRLVEGPAAELVGSAYRLELASADALLAELVLADLAHILVLLDDGIIPAEPGRELLGALLELRETLHGGDATGRVGTRIPLDPGLGDLAMNREAWLRGRIGKTVGYLLVGRPRREAITVAFHLAVRRRVVALARSLEHLQRTIVDLAATHRDTLAVDYTYWQAAQPTTLGHALLAYAYPLSREVDRLREALDRVDRSPAGAGCTNGAGIPVDRPTVGALLGFRGLVIHARDANWQPDIALEATSIAASAALVLDRLAEDLQVWSTREFGFVELADRAARVSLAMPQKKNPYALVFVRGAAARLIGRLAGAGALAKTTTGQPDPRIFAQDEVPDSLELAQQAAALLDEVLAGVRFDRDALGAAARRGYLAGNDLAERIMERSGIPFGDAHRVVGAAVRRALDAGREEDGIDAALLVAAARDCLGLTLDLAEDDVRDALDPDAAIARRTGVGGAAPAAVAAMLADRRRAMRRQREWISSRDRAIAGAEEALLARARDAATA